MFKAIVTGGAGFIGSNLTDLLIDKGFQVIVIDNLETGSEKNLNPKAEFVKEDIRNFEKIEPFFEKTDYVFHLAALPRIQPSFDQPIEHEQANVIGSINCLLACKGKNIKKFVYSASSACYGNPKELPTTEKAEIDCLSPYALQKYTAEQYCLILGERYNIPVVSLRYFNVYGPRSFNEKNPFNAYSSVIGIFENQKKKGEKLTITGDGEQSRDFVHVFDVARANLAAAQADLSFQVYNVGFGKDYTINEIAKIFGSEHVYIPERKGESRITLADISKIKKEFNWEPTISIKDYVEK